MANFACGARANRLDWWEYWGADMDLFENLNDPDENLLPRDGVVQYFGRVMPYEAADAYLDALRARIAWENDELVMGDRRIVTKRKVAWYGDDSFRYEYSRTTKVALPWTKALVEIKGIVEEVTGARYNSCLLNLYHNGSEGMGWHSDNERELKRDGAIASLSLGAERRFLFRHKDGGEVVERVLQHGAVLVMKGATQRHWQHRLPPVAGVRGARINLTFRMFGD